MSATQLTGTNGLAAPAPERCSRRASNSLPVPVSPQISTEHWTSAARETCCAIRSIVGLDPSTRSKPAAVNRSAAAGAPADELTALIMVHCRLMAAVNGVSRTLIKRPAGAVHRHPKEIHFGSRHSPSTEGERRTCTLRRYKLPLLASFQQSPLIILTPTLLSTFPHLLRLTSRLPDQNEFPQRVRRR